jgi:hypothetical protein
LSTSLTIGAFILMSATGALMFFEWNIEPTVSPLAKPDSNGALGVAEITPD